MRRGEDPEMAAWLALLALKRDKGPRAMGHNVGQGGNRISLQPEEEPPYTFIRGEDL